MTNFFQLVLDSNLQLEDSIGIVLILNLLENLLGILVHSSLEE
jgi:hypothetical protein